MTVAERLTEHLSTGVSGLDTLLRGGLRRAGLFTILGRAGAGKTVLAHQMASDHIRAGGKALYLTALTESHQSLIAQARTFSFFDPSVVPGRLYYSSLYPALERAGLGGVGEEIRALINKHAPTLVIVDGVQALRASAVSRLDYQRCLHNIEAVASVTGTTTLLLSNRTRGSVSDPAVTTADGVIVLKSASQQLRSVRLVSVLKMRATEQISGWHTAAITRDGLNVYPRLEALVAADPLPPRVPRVERFTFMAKGLSEMMGGGVTSSSATFIVGTPGSGKTFLTAAFLSTAIKLKQPSLFFGFHETPDRLLLKADAIKLPLRQGVEAGIIEMHWRPASEMLSDEVAERILRIVEARGIRRLVLDGFDQFKRGALLGERQTEFMSAFCDVLRARGVAVVLTADMARIAGNSLDLPITGELSPIIDNIIHVRSTEIHSKFQRLIAILKVRDQDFDRSIREFSIGKTGITIGRVMPKGEALLTGLPRF